MSRVGRTSPRGPADHGQASVEAALLLPIIALAVLAVIQIGLVVHARVMVTHAAREGVRAAAVGDDDAGVREAVIASGGLAPSRVAVTVAGSADHVTVTVRYDAPTNVPLIGPMLDDVELVADATLRRED